MVIKTLFYGGTEIEIHVGDRVVCTVDDPDDNRYVKIGATGTVVRIMQPNPSVGVRFDENIHGHDLGGKCEAEYGWWMDTDQLKPLNAEYDRFEPAGSAEIYALIGGNYAG